MRFPYITNVADRRAFSLTELAIVLGIVGVVVGGVWVAADAVSDRQKVTKAMDELTHILMVLRDMQGGKANPALFEENNLDYGGTVSAGSWSLAYVNAGVVPSDMVVNGIPANPWGKSGIQILAADENGDWITGSGEAVKVSFDNVPRSACIALLTAVTGTNRDKGLLAAWHGDLATEPATKITTLPVTLSAAQTSCSAETQSVGFSFRLVPR